MAELTKFFASNSLYEAWKNNKDVPSNVIAVVLDKTGADVEKVALGTNNIDGQYKTYEVEKGEPKEYANNENVYVCNGTYNFNYDSTCFLQQKNLKNEFEWPPIEDDQYREPFTFTLYGINSDVNVNNIELYWGDILGTAATWQNVYANNKPINYVKNSDGSYTCTVWFNEISVNNDNFFIAYRLPSPIGSDTIDVTPYIIGWWSN